jgi:hypothetical protein
MAERPTVVELIEAVREFLERDLMGAVEGRLAFHTRVAVNALGIVERELELGATHRRAERDRLRDLLGDAPADTAPNAATDEELDALRRRLATAIRSGEFDGRAEEVLARLQETAAAARAIANPKYLN